MVRLAHWCARRWYVVLASWLVALVVLAALVVGLGSKFTDATTIPNSESATAVSLMAKAGIGSGSGESGEIVWHSTGTPVTGTAVRSEIATMLTRISATPGVAGVVSPYDGSATAQVNSTTNTAYAVVSLDSGADTTAIQNAVAQARTANLDIQLGGTAFATQTTAGGSTEIIGVLVALALLLLVFRSIWAAFLPIVTGVAGVAVSLLGVIVASHVINLSSNVITMGALIGLGVGIDYALFIVNRHRKALMAGATVPDAIAQALNTSGRAVIFAGLTVMAALVGMYVVGLGILTGMADAAAFTVLCTVIAANTLLPALLRVMKLKVLSRKQRRQLREPAAPVPARAGRATRSGAGLSSRWADAVQRHPIPAGVAALVVIAALAFPALSLRLGNSDASSDPTTSASHQYYELMSPGFGEGKDATLLLVGETPDTASRAAFTTMVTTLPSVANVASAAVTGEKNGISIAAVTPTHSAQTTQTADLVTTLRDRVIPDAESGTAMHVYVGGTTASDIDMANAILNRLPLYLILIAALGFLLLVLAFRSLLVPLLGAISNLATICVGLGVVTAIFQFGWGSRLLGVGSGAPVQYLVPVMIAGVIFGLSMDYQVFLVSSMHEEFTRSGDNRRAVRSGITDAAKVIVAAATIMLAVFASFGFSGQRIVSAIGIGMAISVVVDAFLVRLTLMPALMTLIGRANWYYPRRLAALTPDLTLENAEPPAAEALPQTEPEPEYNYSSWTRS